MAWQLYAAIAASTAVQAYGQYQTGKAQEAAMKRQAEEERLRAKTEELARREELNKQIAANTLAMAMSGVKAEGTPASIALKSAKMIGESESAISLSERLKQNRILREAEAAKFAGTVGAASTLLKGGESAAMVKYG